MVYLDERMSYRDAAAQVAGFANWLQAQGIEEGDRVAIAMPITLVDARALGDQFHRGRRCRPECLVGCR